MSTTTLAPSDTLAGLSDDVHALKETLRTTNDRLAELARVLERVGVLLAETWKEG